MREGNLNSRTTPQGSPPEAVRFRASLTSNSPRAPLRQANNDPSSFIPRYGVRCPEAARARGPTPLQDKAYVQFDKFDSVGPPALVGEDLGPIATERRLNRPVADESLWNWLRQPEAGQLPHSISNREAEAVRLVVPPSGEALSRP